MGVGKYKRKQIREKKSESKMVRISGQLHMEIKGKIQIAPQPHL